VPSAFGAAPSADGVVWVTPSRVDGPQRSYERVTAALAGVAPTALHELAVWGRPLDEPYGLDVETQALRRTMAGRAWTRCHLVGFSAGATVAIAAALAFGDAVRSLTVVEPATIGDDDWAPVETVFRERLREVEALPSTTRDEAFAHLVLEPGVELPAGRAAPPTWDRRRDRLEGLLAHTGFASADLARLACPCLVVTGGRSHPRFRALAERLVAVVPDCVSVVFPERSHLDPPMRSEPEAFATLLRELWSRDAGQPATA
jgi:pimeloyl-ACP methyl ester carboxylesterase